MLKVLKFVLKKWTLVITYITFIHFYQMKILECVSVYEAWALGRPNYCQSMQALPLTMIGQDLFKISHESSPFGG